LRLLEVLADHDKIIGIPHKAVAGGVELPIQVIQHDIRQQWRNRSSNDIANIGGFLDRLIPRESLRPGYGEGWKAP